MEENRLAGSIPPSLGNCHNLLVINFTSNNLSGTIPIEVFSLSSLSISFAMARNYLTGSLPPEVGNLVNLKELYMSDNRLSGEVPGTLSRCLSLELLLVGDNLLQGTIPESLEVLKEGIFANLSAFSVLGNDKLCGGLPGLNLPGCSQDKSHSSGKLLSPRVVIQIIVSIVVGVILSCAFTARYFIRNSKKRPLTASSTNNWRLGVSYQELLKSTDGFSANNLIGSGSFGSVYKATVNGNGATVAVKALRSIRHRNLLKVITVCSSVDYQGNDFKCIVSEFMANGNLDQWLHPGGDEQSQARRLSLLQRLNIAVDVVSALDYLHRQCETPIVHCDLKPTNILLDDDMTAHVGDFGLAKLLLEEPNDEPISQSISARLKGSFGYVPPEYGIGGQVSTLGDVYSNGILPLQMITGKRPTDDIFKDGLSIHNFAKMALPENIMEIVDSSLLLAGKGGNLDENGNEEREIVRTGGEDSQRSGVSRMEECLVSVIEIGLWCSADLPGGRMPMSIAVNRMHKIRNSIF
ncbi:unnamed protein product [Ilex paraguariensis]|uniref:non-specific serine/threonine protein kinase n=1 Tax=Ilex paraguariensis TaxID=185542 RepID=A0ABC8R6G3_9AQUA